MNDLICYSHLRWDFVFQRPHHLMTRAVRDRRVWFVEEPLWEEGRPRLRRARTPEGVEVCTPVLPPHLDAQAREWAVAGLLAELAMVEGIHRAVAWVYTPLMFPLVDAADPSVVVYDCMDELSALRDAPGQVPFLERALFSRADLVFAGGHGLYEAKRGYHPRVHLFPSSVDAEHFRRARAPQPEPPELVGLPRPRLGWVGVIDERMDVALLAEVARRRPGWSWVLVGPVVRVDPDTVPRAPNLHRLGSRGYADLPAWLAHIDVAIMPFAIHEATRFHSPTNALEYLCAGLPVVSTPVRDVVRTYGARDLVRIAEDPDAFLSACEAALAERASGDLARRARADAFLRTTSWDATWAEMDALLHEVTSAPVLVLDRTAP